MSKKSKTPVKISGASTKALAMKMREWSGWRDATLIWGDPMPVSPYAMCDHSNRRFTINADELVLNPNRVLGTITPFRLKQEAVLTGAMLHEAAHARYSRWLPRNDAELKEWKHSDGTTPTPATVDFARLVEEARIEGHMAREGANFGAAGLEWTMRATAAQVLPMTPAAADPAQALMDLISSWVLRAGRQHTFSRTTLLPGWVRVFDFLLGKALMDHFEQVYPDEIHHDWEMRRVEVVTDLHTMLQSRDHDGSDLVMIDRAKSILSNLFPNGQGDMSGVPKISGGCSGPDDSDEQDSGEGQGDSGAGEGSEADAGADTGQDGTDSEEGEGSGGEEVPDASGTEPTPAEQAAAQAMAEAMSEALAEMEKEVGKAEQEAAEDEQEVSGNPDTPGSGAGGGDIDSRRVGRGGWATPNKADREVQAGAERFLRDLIDPSESVTETLTDTPSARVDGAALAAWKAGGSRTDPRFFIRTSRIVQPTPPVKIAILVDTSMSMEIMQEPSALLSWALSNAALDLSNFAGRGTQVESTLIHWGSSARVIQRNGDVLPGIREVRCNEYTDHLHDAMAMVEQEIPGFYSISDKPENRLLVNFTDWELGAQSERLASPWINRAMAVGVTMLSVVPGGPASVWGGGYNMYRSKLPWLMSKVELMNGRSELLPYIKGQTDVWAEAARLLQG